MTRMQIIKRNGRSEEVSFDKIYRRINILAELNGDLTNVNTAELAQLVIQGLRNNMKTSEIDIYTAKLAEALGPRHREYLTLASRIAVDNHQKNTLNSFADKMSKLYLNRDSNGVSTPIVSYEFNKFVSLHSDAIDKYIKKDRDFHYDYFGFSTLETGYLLSINGEVIERPQDLIMRAAIQINIPHKISEFKNKGVLAKIFETYDLISQRFYTPATPTLFNSGSPTPGLSSCFLLGGEDSLEGILTALKKCCTISKGSGGIGYHIHNLRCNGALIKGTNGKSDGIIPQLRMFNAGARAYNQGGGKRKGSWAPYLEPHHPDIMAFLRLRLDDGKDENLKCRDLFPALWISDLFMERVKSKGKWSTFCPNTCPGLEDVYADQYKELYLRYENENRAHTVYEAQEVWNAIYESLCDSGLPYMNYKDNVNRVNMQSNIGIIKSSNLCCEIEIYSDSKQFGVCNLSSICVNMFVHDSYSEAELQQDESVRRVLDDEFPVNPVYDYKRLAEVAGIITENLNNTIDRTNNPVVEGARGNFLHRPIGIGLQGLADVFFKFHVAYDSDIARELNKNIAEAIYYGALSASTKMCRAKYHEIIKNFDDSVGYTATVYTEKVLETYPELRAENVIAHYTKREDVPKNVFAYSSYLANGGSHISRGVFHWELFGLKESDLSGIFDWNSLRGHIKIFGVRNSLTTCMMPTGSTSQIMGNASCFEPIASNIFTKTTLAGNFTVINKYLIKYLQDAGLNTDDFTKNLIANNGSIQFVDGIPDNVKKIFRTAYEIPQRSLVEMNASRQAFIDQSQSFNVFFEDFTISKFSSCQMLAWKLGCKTGSYYTRTRESVMAQKFTIEPEIVNKLSLEESIIKNKNIGRIQEEEICLSCSS